MSPFTKKKATKKTTKQAVDTPTLKVPKSSSANKKKQINISDTFESNGVELEISTVETGNHVEVVGARVRVSSGASWIYVDPGKLGDLAIVLIEAGYPKL